MDIKKINQKTFFSEEKKLDMLNKKGNPLKKLNECINWNIFNRILENTFKKDRKDKRGRPHYNYVMMFKILILESIYQLSDDEMEYQILDRMSFKDFLGLSSEDNIPDSKTIWHFKNVLSENKKIGHLFNKFNKELDKNNMLVNEGVIVDASIIEAEQPKNTKDENNFIKEIGKKPDEWSDNKKSQKDIDANWTKKRNKNYFGYKNHIKIDNETKFIIGQEVTAANVHDSQVLEKLITKKDKEKKLWGDSAYKSKEINEMLEKKNIEEKINYRSYKNKKLSEKEKKLNKEYSKVRARVEHVFAYMKYNLSMRKIRSIGIKRAETIIGLSNLAYNMKRFVFYMNKQIA